MNARPLACGLWLLRVLGRPVGALGELSGIEKPTPALTISPEAVQQTMGWIVDHGLDWPGDFSCLGPLTPGVASLPAMRLAVAEAEPEMQRWLERVWPHTAVTDEAAPEQLRWLLRRSLRSGADERIFILPSTGGAPQRVDDDTYLVSRQLLRDVSAFRLWARQRRRMRIRTLAAVVGAS